MHQVQGVERSFPLAPASPYCCVRVVQRHVHLGVTHDSLHDRRVLLLVHKERGQAVASKIVQAKP